MNYLLDCTVLELIPKNFRDESGKAQTYYQAQVYQPGIGVDAITISKDLAESGAVQIGGRNLFAVTFYKGKPRISDLVKGK